MKTYKKVCSYFSRDKIEIIAITAIFIFSIAFVSGIAVNAANKSNSMVTDENENIKNEFDFHNLESSYISGSVMPTTINIIVILVNFTDTPQTLTKAQMEAKFFGTSNSLKDYISKVSFGAVTVQGVATEWLSIGNTKDWYGADGTGYDNNNGFSHKIIQDALAIADASVNFQNYDRVMIVHAGNDQALSSVSNDVWTQTWMPQGDVFWVKDSKVIETASILAENENFGVYCREFAHSYDVPDLTDSLGNNDVVDKWCLMGLGYLNGNNGDSPAQMMGFTRDFLGFFPSNKIRTVYDDDVVQVNLDAMEVSGDNYHLIKLPIGDQNYYYTIEARAQTGYDTALPGAGVIISKVDTTKAFGAGIVTVMDSRPATTTKNDGEYDVSSISEKGIFVDSINNIRVIIVSKSSNTYTIQIDRYNTWTYTDETVAAGAVWEKSLGTITAVGREIVWDWNRISGGSYDADFWIELVSPSNTYETITHITNDTGVYKITTAGVYHIHIRNNNVLYPMNFQFYSTVYSAYSVSYQSVSISPSSIYKDQPVQFTAVIKNTGFSTIKSITVQPSLPSQFSFAAGETSSRTCLELGYNDIFTATWWIVGQFIGGPYQFDTVVTSSLSGNWHSFNSFSILSDTTKPTIAIQGEGEDFMHAENWINITWTASDTQSGIEEFNIYRNSVKLTTLSKEYRTYNYTGLAQGIYTLTVEAVDYSNNKQNSTVQGICDFSNPTIALFDTLFSRVAPNSKIGFNISVADAYSGVHLIEIFKRDIGVSSEMVKILELYHQSGNLILYYDLGVVVSTSYLEFKLKVTDNVGHIFESQDITRYLDKNPPTLTVPYITSDSAEPGIYKGNLYITFSATDMIGIQEVVCEFNINGHVYRNPATLQAGQYRCTFDTTGKIFQGSILITIRAYDLAGNTNQRYQSVLVSNPNDFMSLMLYLPLIIAGVILGVSVLFVVLIIKIRNDPINIINTYDRKKEKFASKPHASSAGRTSSKPETQPPKAKNSGYIDASQVKSVSSQSSKTAPVVKKATPINFSRLTSEDTAIRIPSKVSEIAEIEKPDTNSMNKFFKNVEKNLKKNMKESK